ncbi:hypothetical protein KJ652_02810 [Patescibacteria group bacterium]|nr:hypothetical protein [Patescibacteria group bacterium]
MNKPQAPTQAQTYCDLYSGETILIKASGKEMLPNKLSALVDNIKSLIANGIHVIFVFGGGDQIDEEWHKTHSEPRKKPDGVGETSEKVLNDGVIPAYTKLREQIESLLPELTVIDPSQIECDIDDSKGLVGIPTEFRIETPQDIAIGFMGHKDEQQLNVNGDDQVRGLVKQFGDQINAVIMLTDIGGVVDDEGKRVNIILSHEMNDDGTHKRIKITGGMKKKLKVGKQILPDIGKFAMTTGSLLQEEIESWRGSGTLCVQTDQLSCSPPNQREIEIFMQVYQDFVASGDFRNRTPNELQEIIDHHFILRIKNSPLGGFSLIPREEEYVEMSVLWSGYLNNGIGKILGEEAKRKFGEMANARTLFALTTPKDHDDVFENFEERVKIIRRFLRYGFSMQGYLKDVRGSYQIKLPKMLKEYDVEKRNPLMFTYRK